MLVINGQELFNYKEIAAELKLVPNSVHIKLLRRGIKPVYVEKNKNYKTRYYTREQMDQLKAKQERPKHYKTKKEKVIKPKKPRLKNYWKLSVFNDDLQLYEIKSCGLPQYKATAEKKKLEAQGFDVRISKHTETVDQHGKIKGVINGREKFMSQV